MLLRLLCYVFTCVPALLCAQQSPKDPQLTLSSRDREGLIEIVADNREYMPCSVVLDFELANMEVVERREDTLVVPPRSQVVVYRLRPGKAAGRYGYGYDVHYAHGDYRKLPYDTNFVYALPFAPGRAYRVDQAYGGTFSHRGEAALDFSMPEGTPVYAARGGTVVQLTDTNDQHCAERRCAQFNNAIEVLHSDGTYADYTHLQKDGAAVVLGQRVEQGQLIGYSGWTGYSSGPHLHFGVYRQGWAKREYLPVTLQTQAGPQVGGDLVEGQLVRRPL